MDIPSPGQQHPISTIHSVNGALDPPPDTPDGRLEFPQGCLEVIVHSLSKLTHSIFASETVNPEFRLASQYLSATSGVPQAKKPQQDSFFIIP